MLQSLVGDILFDRKLGRVSVLEETELLVKVQQVGNDNEFWYPRSKLRFQSQCIKKPRSTYPPVRRRSLDISDEPWRAYVRATGKIYANGRPSKLQKFFYRLYQANGQQLTLESPGITVDAENSNHWGVSLHLYFAAPIPEDFPRNIATKIISNRICITNGTDLIWDLLDNGMLIG